MKKIIYFILILVILFAAYVSVDANKYKAMVRVIDGEGKVGVNPTDLALDFGDLSRGTSAVRKVTLENNSFLPMKVVTWKRGRIAGLMDVDKSNFRLEKGAKETIEFTTYIPASAVVGENYQGKVIIFRIPVL
mgnify:CR=1 FL=1